MDLMADIETFRSSPAQRAARNARRQLRHAAVYDAIAPALGRDARIRWNFGPGELDDEVAAGVPVGHQHPGAAAILLVRQALAEFQLPTNVNLRVGGLQRASGHSAFNTDEGTVTVDAEMCSVSGPRHHVSIPVSVRRGRLLNPSVLFHNGQARVITQHTFDDILGMGEFTAAIPDRPNMYSPPPDKDAGAPSAGQRVPLLRPGMFKVSPGRQLVSAALRGYANADETDAVFREREAQLRRTGFYQPDVTGFVPNGLPGADVPGADGSHLDVGERPVPSFGPGSRVRMKSEGTTRDRGGVVYKLPRGTTGVVVRDVDGAGRAMYVRFPELGFAAVVPVSGLSGRGR